MSQHLHDVSWYNGTPNQQYIVYQHQSILTDLPSQESKQGPLGEKIRAQNEYAKEDFPRSITLMHLSFITLSKKKKRFIF